ncbi:uncharacterized protein ssh2a [Aplochiton taeniatus]
MTLGSLSGTEGSAEGCFCSCCGAKMPPYFSDDAVASQNQINQHISESFLTVKGAALFLPRGHGSSPNSAPHSSQQRNKHTGDLQQHLQTMLTLLRPEDNIRLAVRLESAYPQCTRYMVVVSTNGRQDTEESVVLGMDFASSDCTIGLVLPLWSDSLIHLDGDGGFSVNTASRVHLFKPVSVQAMWSALQSLHKACEVARCHNYYPGSLFLTWVSYYQSHMTSDQLCINEWNAMRDVQSHRADSPVLFTDVPTERERTERLIKTRLREIMMQKDLENVTSKEIRTELEMHMVCNLREFKEFIDNEMIVILGQMDSPTEIFDHVYLGSEWNASNLEELQNSGVQYILNVTREIDNFFPGLFEYHNIRVYDEEATNLLEYWNDTYKFISRAKRAGAKCLVHCKMGVSRSASTVIAYAMKEYGWDLERAFHYVKERRAVTKPNPSFMRQLEEYQGILLASKQRHNKLWRSHSESDLLDCPNGLRKPASQSHNNSNNTITSSPALHHFLGEAVLQVLAPDERGTRSVRRVSTPRGPSSPGLSLHLPEETSPNSDALGPPLSEWGPVAVVTSPLSPSAVAAPGPRDNNNNPSHFETGSVLDSPAPLQGSSGSLSDDSIDFFSARKMFMPLHTKPTCFKPSHRHDNGSLTPPSHPLSPSTPPFDWPAGSVRRALRQLEERLKQEQETPPQMTQRSPLHSPGSQLLANQSLLCSPSSELPANKNLLYSPSSDHSANRTPLSSPSSDSSNKVAVCSETRANQTALCWPTSEHPCVRCPLSVPPEGSPSPSPLSDLPQQRCLSPGQSLAYGEGLAGGLQPKESTRQLERLNSSDMDTLSDPSLSPSPGPAPPTPDLSIPSTVPLSQAAMVLSAPVSASMMVEPLDSSPDTNQRSGSQEGLVLGGGPPIRPTPGTKLQYSLQPSRSGAKHGLEQGSQELEEAIQRLEQGKPQMKREEELGQEKHGMDQVTHGLDQGKHFLANCSQGGCLGVLARGEAEGGSLGVFPGGTSRGVGSGLRPSRATGPGWQRALELEARIRQAGLTPPSLLKRSASLAKLDRLELSAADLSQWELRASPASLAKLDWLEQSAADLSQRELRAVGWFCGTYGTEGWKKQKGCVQLALFHS